MRIYDTAIFDMDGTLLNTLDDLTDTTNHVLRTFGYKERTIDEIRHFVGNGIKLLMKRALPEGIGEERFEECFAEFKKYYAVHCADKTAPYKGLPELLAKLRGEGYKIAVVSNKVDFAVKELCDRYFPGLTDDSEGDREGMRRKPDPDLVFLAMEKLGASKESSVYIGDSETDFMTAKNSGLPCISVLWGFRTRDELDKIGASCYASNADELFDLLVK